MADSQWHLDKRVPISLIILILFQTGGLLWGFFKTVGELQADNAVQDEQIIEIKEKQFHCSERQSDFENRADGIATSMATLVERTANMKEDLKEIKNAITK